MFVLILVTALALAAIQNRVHMGEMDFGGLVGFLPPVVLSLVQAGGMILAFLLMSLCLNAMRHASERGFVGLVLAVSIPYLLVSAMSRPAQRYLILILPLFLIWFVYMTGQLRPKFARVLMVGSLLAFTGLSTLGILYLDGQAQAADRMGRWIVEHRLTRQTDPGILAGHIGYLFPVQTIAKPAYRLEIWPRQKKFPQREASVKKDQLTHVQPVWLGAFIVKQFVLCPNPIK